MYRRDSTWMKREVSVWFLFKESPTIMGEATGAAGQVAGTFVSHTEASLETWMNIEMMMTMIGLDDGRWKNINYLSLFVDHFIRSLLLYCQNLCGSCTFTFAKSVSVSTQRLSSCYRWPEWFNVQSLIAWSSFMMVMLPSIRNQST